MQLKDHIEGLLFWISSCHKSSDLEKKCETSRNDKYKIIIFKHCQKITTDFWNRS